MRIRSQSRIGNRRRVKHHFGDPAAADDRSPTTCPNSCTACIASHENASVDAISTT